MAIRLEINILFDKTVLMAMLHVIRITSITLTLIMWPNLEWIFIASRSAGRG